MATCLADSLWPAAGVATVKLLRKLGHEVQFPEAQTCYGQPMFNSGFADLARQQARHTIGVFVVPHSGGISGYVCCLSGSGSRRFIHGTLRRGPVPI